MGSNYQRYNFEQKNGDDGILHEEISSLNFRVYASKELKELSTCHVTSPRSFDYLHHPIPGKIFPSFQKYHLENYCQN